MGINRVKCDVASTETIHCNEPKIPYLATWNVHEM